MSYMRDVEPLLALVTSHNELTRMQLLIYLHYCGRISRLQTHIHRTVSNQQSLLYVPLWRSSFQVSRFPLTHWDRLTNICVGKLTSIGSDNGLSPGRSQAIIWTSAESFKKMHLKMSSAKWRPFCLWEEGRNIMFCYINVFYQVLNIHVVTHKITWKTLLPLAPAICRVRMVVSLWYNAGHFFFGYEIHFMNYLPGKAPFLFMDLDLNITTWS